MSAPQRQVPNAQTFYAELSELKYEAVETANGIATSIRFHLPGENLRLGDVLVVLEGSEIRFHGSITSIDQTEGAVAVDRRGSALIADVQ